MTKKRRKSLRDITHKSFRLFLSHSDILEDDNFQKLLLEAGNPIIDCSPGKEHDPCQWLLIRGLHDDEKPNKKQYMLFIRYEITKHLFYESCYILLKDIRDNELSYYPLFSRISEYLEDETINYCPEEDENSDPEDVCIVLFSGEKE